MPANGRWDLNGRLRVKYVVLKLQILKFYTAIRRNDFMFWIFPSSIWQFRD